MMPREVTLMADDSAESMTLREQLWEEGIPFNEIPSSGHGLPEIIWGEYRFSDESLSLGVFFRDWKRLNA
jgi:hypothetical protein